ncbi:MAG: BatA domain-containing protein, partial [Pirellulales bacterium]
MTFLFWAFLGGTAAVAFPLLFHLIRRTPKGRQDFSALMFLRPSPPRLTRRSRLDHLLLLLLRAAAIVLIALAFMRPFWRAADEAFADPPGRRVALLVDTSASMKRGDLWRQALAQADNVLDGLEAADDVALFAFDDRLRPIVPFDSGAKTESQIAIKRAIVRAKLKESTPTWGHTDLGGALVSAADALAAVADMNQSSDTDGRPTAAAATSQIVVITDMQEGARTDALSAFEWPEQVQVDVRTVAVDGSSNARVALLSDDPAAIGPQEPRVRVWNAADSAIEQFRVAWASEKSGERDIAARAVTFYVPPGQSRVLPVPRGRENDGAEHADTDRLVLLDDDEPFDNAYFVAPRLQREVRAVGVGRDRPDDAQGLRYYLARAVAETPRRKVTFDWREPGGDLSTLAVERPHLVCVTDAVSAAEGEAIARYVDAGGAVLVVLRDAGMAESLFGLIGATGVKEHEHSGGVGEYAMLGQIEFSHPLFAPFAAARYSDFTKIRFWRRRTVTLDEAAQVQVVARFDDGSPAIWQRPLGKGHAVVLASGWHPRDSQWALSTKFLPMMSGLFDRVGPRFSTAATHLVHEAVALPDLDPQRVSDERAADRIVRTPDGGKVVLASAATAFDATDAPGVYEVESADDAWTFAVNLASRESDTAPLEPAQLEALGVKLGMHLSSSEQATRERQLRDTELESRQKIWKWLIVGALCVLGLETALAGWRSRAPAAPLGEP